MAHPKREAEATALYNQLKDTGFIKTSIVYDEKNEEWDTGKRSLQDFHPDAMWHIVLQDDAVLPPNFHETVCSLLRHADFTLTSFYVGQCRPFPQRVNRAVGRAIRSKSTWLEARSLYWGVGVAIPTNQINDVLEGVKDCDLPYDQRLGFYYDKNNMPVRYTLPSIVDHKDDGSLLPGHDRRASSPRVAHQFIGDRNIDWNDKVVKM